MQPATDCDPEEHEPWYAGVDVGGTSIKLGVISASGKIISETSIPTHNELGPVDAIKRILDTLITLMDGQRERIAGAGLGTPGPLDTRRGMVLDPVNMPGWRNFPIRDELSRALKFPITYANDANAAAWGEYWIGTGQAYQSLVLITLGTGVGTGIIIDDQMVVGSNDQGAECGHIVVDYSDDARKCSCGRKGHLEAYASASAVVAKALDHARQFPDSELGRLLKSGGDLSARDVYHCAERNDPAAWHIIDQSAEFLARGIANIAQTVDPDIFLLGGAMNFGGPNSPVGQRFLNKIDEIVRAAVFERVARNLKIEFASLGGSAGWIGAAGLAQRVYDQMI